MVLFLLNPSSEQMALFDRFQAVWLSFHCQGGVNIFIFNCSVYVLQPVKFRITVVKQVLICVVL